MKSNGQVIDGRRSMRSLVDALAGISQALNNPGYSYDKTLSWVG